MLRWILSVCVVVTVGNIATAHFYFLLPGGPQQSPKIVLADRPEPDATVSLDLALQGKFTAVSKSGDATPLQTQRGEEGYLTFGILPAETATVMGTVDYGVVIRGQSEPVLIRHHAKLIVTPLIADVQKQSPAPVEINVVTHASGVVFQVTVNGKPVEADLSVYLPDTKRVEVVHTDAQGMTKPFDKKGQYAARVFVTENRSGEYQGRAYKQVRHYATIVVVNDHN